ncbi:MAG: DUF5690 family protein, partial [Myxococcota bacterium]
MFLSSRMRQRLADAPPALFAAYAIVAAFSTYFCMYAFRKPFAAAEFEGLSFFGLAVDLKTAFVISQILGYTLSKFMGIRILSALSPTRRAGALIGLILAAEAALLLLGALPPSWGVVALFLNGVPLGMVWGLVVSYLEGRRSSELLLAGLSCSFIVASGVVKDIGRWLIQSVGVAELWMPAATGAMFLLPFIVSVWLLQQLPDPTAEDVALRSKRAPMSAGERRAFVRRFAGGLGMLVAVYFFLTAFRDFRDNYGADLFRELGYGETPAIFSLTELPVAFGVMIAMAALNLVQDNRRGLMATFAVMIAGVAMVGGATAALDLGVLSGVPWMILIGLGSYLAYVPFNALLFDRMIAYTRARGTALARRKMTP